MCYYISISFLYTVLWFFQKSPTHARICGKTIRQMKNNTNWVVIILVFLLATASVSAQSAKHPKKKWLQRTWLMPKIDSVVSTSGVYVLLKKHKHGKIAYTFDYSKASSYAVRYETYQFTEGYITAGYGITWINPNIPGPNPFVDCLYPQGRPYTF